MKKPELVAPAGSLEKLEIAYLYGADAAYAGLKEHSLRLRADNLTFTELKKAVRMAGAMRRKFSLALNAFFYEQDLKKLDTTLKKIRDAGCGTLIVSDPGVFLRIREKFPSFRIHLSTQANTTNSGAVRFWTRQGVSRIILARELTLREIASIRRAAPKAELEVFVHGAMCLAYSGRCFLSLYLSGRNANRGDCSQPCRWAYHLQETKRPGDFFPVLPAENGKGTVILSSRDLNLAGHIPALLKAGVTAFKIEGRMKSLYYTAVTTAAYRAAIDAAWKKTAPPAELLTELDHASHRPYFSGFLAGRREIPLPLNEQSYVRRYSFTGWIKKKTGSAIYSLEIKNPIRSQGRYECFRWDDPSEPLPLRKFTLLRRGESGRLEEVRTLRIQDRGFVRTPLPLRRGWILRERLVDFGDEPG